MTPERSTLSYARCAPAPHPSARSAKPMLAASLQVISRRAFSLIEVLLAIFILGVGVISIAALFPAGIVQQRMSVDDMIGQVVANNAIELIRSKVSRNDFGTFEEFDDPANPTIVRAPRATVHGDWSWLRPGIMFGNDPNRNTCPFALSTGDPFNDEGTIDIFSWYSSPGAPAQADPATEFPTGYAGTLPLLRGVPYNRVLYGNVPPRVLITQRERFYPQASTMYNERIEPGRNQYVWDCAFRRFQGKVLVAIFVYRVNQSGGGPAVDYKVAKNPSSPNIPPMPIWLNFVDSNMGDTNTDVCAGGPWDTVAPAGVTNPAVVLGVPNGTRFNADDQRHAWQNPRQWIIDQNNNVHRVVGQNRSDMSANTGDMQIELSRPVSAVPASIDAALNTAPHFDASGNPFGITTHYFYRPQSGGVPTNYGWATTDVVTDIWYVPLSDSNGMTLTPVYATVKEL